MIKNKIIYFGLIFYIISVLKTQALSPLHPFYLSITEIRINTEQKILQVSCRMFMDDLEYAISKLYDIKADIIASVKNQSLHDVLFQYIRQHLSIQVGGIFLQPNMLGYEIEEEAVWCHLELAQIDVSNQVKITNTILYEFIPSQTNIIHCYMNDVRKSTKLVNPDSKAIFEF